MELKSLFSKKSAQNDKGMLKTSILRRSEGEGKKKRERERDGEEDKHTDRQRDRQSNI